MDKPLEHIEAPLVVPQDAEYRTVLRKEIRHFLKGKDMLPPLSIDSLKKHAEDFAPEHAVPAEFLNFLMVLIGNESWRKAVEATPYSRRLLLLPQCVKNKEHCRGAFDELGLVCAGCKSCPIDDILNEAEAMGYATLVAEGTTVAIGLVEEGSIDAVIGVSCMPVLQKSFHPVSKAAVPVIGIPLMYDGCENTKLDCDWLSDELHATSGESACRPLSVSLIRRKLNDFFLPEKVARIIDDDEDMNGLAAETLSAGGRRMRPLLTALSYLSWQPEATDDMLIRLAFIIESFHKASLIHDDIQDNSPERYDRPSLHISHGTGVAINVGDYLIGKGYSLLSGLPLPPERIAKCLQAVSSSHVKMTLGQAQDITVDPLHPSFLPEKACRINGLKTGEAVKVALLLGAIAAGAPEKDLIFLTEFADAFGMAYQIRDDLNEFEENAGHDNIRDYPILLSIIHEKGLSHLLQTNGHSLPEMVRKIVEDHKLTDAARELLREKVAACYACLDKLDNFKLRLALCGLMGKIY